MTMGDIVKLRGGDRPMVILGVYGENVECGWFEGNDQVEAEFHIDSLIKVASGDLNGASLPLAE